MVIAYRDGGASQARVTAALPPVAVTPVGELATPVVAEVSAAAPQPAALRAWSSMS